MKWTGMLVEHRRYTALTSPNKDETAVCGCNPAVSVLVVVMSRKVYFSRSMISLACIVISFHFIADQISR